MSDIDCSANSHANNRRFGDKVSISKQWLSFAGDCAPLRKYLASRSFSSAWAPLKFLDALFRGYGQVVFANNPISGILIFISLTVANPLVSAAGLLTASVGLVGSIMILPQPSEVVSQGVTVFNSLLIGLITTGTLPARYGLQLETWHWFTMVIAATASVYVESAVGNILGSLCRFPLPILTVPFNIVQQMLFVTLLSITTLNARDTSPIVTHHVTSQPQPLIPSSLISIEMLRQIPDAMTEPQLLDLTSLETRPAGMLIGDSTTDIGTLIGEYLENYAIDTHTLSTQHIVAGPSEAVHFEDTFQNSQTVSKTTQEIVTEHDRHANVRFDTASGFRSIQKSTTGANDFEQKEASVSTLAKHNMDMAATESLHYATSTQPDFEQINSTSSVQNHLEVIYGAQNDTEGEHYDAGSRQNTASGALGSPASEATAFQSTSVTTGNNEANVFANEGTVTVRLRRSVFLETTQRNSLAPQQNASFEVMETVVDWGGVFSGVVLSMSQVYGTSHAPAAVLMYLAVLIYSPIMAAFAVLGAAVGTLTGVLLTDVNSYMTAGGVYDGTWGFNGLLSAMCLGGLFFVVNWHAAVAAVLCSFLSTVILNVLISPFAQANLSPMSLPFNVSTLLFLCVSSSGAIVRPEVLSFPERHRHEYKHMQLQTAQEGSPSTSDMNDKDEDMEKKTLSEVKVV